MYLVKPKKGTTMETIGRYSLFGLKLGELGPKVWI